MLRMGPWNRLGLSIRWLSDKHVKDFYPDQPPLHMTICFGHIKIKKRSKANVESKNDIESVIESCGICFRLIDEEDFLRCLNPKCSLISHLFCLAERFLATTPGFYVPVQGECPDCRKNLMWSDLILFKENKVYDLFQCENDIYEISEEEFIEDGEEVVVDDDDEI